MKIILLASRLGKAKIILYYKNKCHDCTTILHAVNRVKCRVGANMVTRAVCISRKQNDVSDMRKHTMLVESHNISDSMKSPLHFDGILVVYASRPPISFPSNCRLMRAAGTAER
jgi:hypothetical protein